MNRTEELCRSFCEVDGTSGDQWRAKIPQAEAAMRVFNRWAPYLVPATCKCPDCGTVAVIASPAPIRCHECGVSMVVVSS